MQKPEGERPEPVDVSGEMKRLGELQATQRDRGDVERRIHSLEESIEENQEEVSDAQKAIAELQEKLTRAKRELEQIKDRGSWLLAEKTAADEELAEMPVVDGEIESVTDRISQAGAVNEALEPWKEWERAQASIAEHRTERDTINELLGKLEHEKAAAISGAALPFTGLTLDDDGEILIDGSPLSAASGMERCRLALEVAIADDPDLGVVFMNGNELDLDALAEIHRLAEEHDFQVIMDIIHSPGYEGEVRMIDGVAHQEGAPEPVEA